MIKRVWAIVLLSTLWVCLPVLAASIDADDAAAVLESLGLSPKDKRSITTPLFEFSPFSANNRTVVPGFADPLGMGVDPELRIFSGRVQFMDLLGNYNAAKPNETVDIKLPQGALKGINLLDNFIAVYLSYNGRAFDSSLLNLQTAEVIERNGLPVTSETSPLTLAGFGSVADHLKPYSRHWTRCTAKDKRERALAKAIKSGRGPGSVPAASQCYDI
jgi:hypothetical protein